MKISVCGSKHQLQTGGRLSGAVTLRPSRARPAHPQGQRRLVLLATSNPDSFQKRDEVRRLERLLYEQHTESEHVRETLYNRPATFNHLPLWRVEWAVLPSMQEILHVHSPHYVHMFETMFRQPGPWRFGHVYLPGGSKNLGDPQFQLKAGSKAPLVGVLMEVSRAVRLMDGKLLVLATAVTRIKVTHVVSETPYSTANVEVLPDDEELAEQRACAVSRALEVAGDECSLEEVMAAASSAARQAAAAAAHVWQRYELAVGRAQHWDGQLPREALDQQDASHLAQELVSHGVKEVLPLPDGPVVGRWDLVQLATAAELAADLAAMRCAREWLRPDLALPGESGSTPQELFAGFHTTNSVAERGVAVQVAQLEDESSLGLSGDPLQDLLIMEQLVWQELDAVAGLATKVHKARISLPLGLLQLRPEPVGPTLFPSKYLVYPISGSGTTAEASAATRLREASQHAQGRQFRGAASGGLDVHADPTHPVLRRTQRLSFALAASFLDGDMGEGRQAFLEAGSTCARLKLALAMLQRNRKLLAAVSAVMEIK